MFANTMSCSRDMFQQDGLGMTMPVRPRPFAHDVSIRMTNVSTAGIRNYVRQLVLVEGTDTMQTQQTRGQRIDEMIRRRGCMGIGQASDDRASLLVTCALKGVALPDDVLPPEAPAVYGNPTMQAWLPNMEARSEMALRGLAKAYNEQREACLGAAEPLDRLRAIDAVRRSLIVAVGRNDEDVAQRALALLNDLGACDAHGRKLSASDCVTLEELDKALDAKVRPLEYWLAIHHYERCWLSNQRHAILGRNRHPRVA